MSAIRAIYSALAAKSITFSRENGQSVTVDAWDLHQTKNRLEVSDLPIRILSPVGPDAESLTGRFILIGTTAKTEWRLTDDLFWRPVMINTNLHQVYPDLIRYAGAYFDMLRTFRQPVNSSSGSRTVLTTWSIEPAILQYAESQYFGLRCKIAVEEFKV